ncbi:uncharacterized protein EV420DRAFT_1745531 [Desarmillaria tabescens]|uniref:Uncharacterized protein n=1 Tax=Armillaria tabescens TaxID=1929756 RepID=A0AA39TL56_ARMTA|nr:uncharacterized protein EV420DRAFT_1745531 [Desarmillaria tabescens]KAK0462972.1 hypothetical protein EV420DRAFT_1745531 [Desarmillaria tabescens]
MNSVTLSVDQVNDWDFDGTTARDLEKLVGRVDYSDPDDNFKGLGEPESLQMTPCKSYFSDDQAPRPWPSERLDASGSEESKEWTENDSRRKMVTLLDEDALDEERDKATSEARERIRVQQGSGPLCSGTHIESVEFQNWSPSFEWFLVFGPKKKRRQEIFS